MKNKISLLGNTNAKGNKGKPKSEEHKLKISLANKGKPKPETSKLKQSASMSGRRWWSKDGISVKNRECPGEGWVLGRTSIKKK